MSYSKMLFMLIKDFLTYSCLCMINITEYYLMYVNFYQFYVSIEKARLGI
jgi:hypothetical protein